MSIAETHNIEERMLARHALSDHKRTVPLRHVAVLADRARLRRFHRELAARLERETGVRVSLLRGTPESPLPSSVDLLLSLERMLDRSSGVGLGEPLVSDQTPFAVADRDDAPDIVIDLCGNATGKQRVLRLLYDGVAGEKALIGALLAGRMPVMEIEESRSGSVLARGMACADNARTIAEAFESVLTRAVDLVILSLRGRQSLFEVEKRKPLKRTARLRDIVAFEARTLPYTIARRLYHMCCYAPHWRTCWRFVDGPGVLETSSLTGPEWNILPDPGFRFYTDPFPFHHEGKDWVFVEDFNHLTGKGSISVVPFGESGPLGPARTVLEEPWHLSYPFVFAHRGEVWMMPESSANRSLHLYRADSFPESWVLETTLLENIEASDATMFPHAGAYWMFAATRSRGGSWSDTLSIFSAPDPLGPWQPHSGNPVLIDQATARPAGAIFRRNEKLWRPVQDCTHGYGTGIGLVEITRLDHDVYEQRLHTVLRPKPEWPGKRLHTLNRMGRLECIDGSAHSPRSRTLAKWLEEWSGRREQSL